MVRVNGTITLGRRWKGSGRYNEGGNSRCCREVFLGACWGRGRILYVGDTRVVCAVQWDFVLKYAFGPKVQRRS